ARDALGGLGAEEGVEGCDERQRGGRERHRRQELAELARGEDRDEAREVGGGRERGWYGADDRAETFALAQRGQAVVGAGPGDQAENERRDSRGHSRTQPDDEARHDADQAGQGLGQRGGGEYI